MDRHSLAEIHISPKILDNALFAQHNSPTLSFQIVPKLQMEIQLHREDWFAGETLCECEGTLDYPSFSLAEGVKIK